MAGDHPLKAQILEAAELTGWRRVHNRPARTEKGWRTALEGDAGFPDIVIARHGVTKYFEVKGPAGYPSLEQLAWLAHLGPDAALVRPCDWPLIEAILKRKPAEYLTPTLCAINMDVTPDDLSVCWLGPLAAWATKKWCP